MSKIRSPTLYKAERKTDMTDIVANAVKKMTIGPGTFNPKMV